MLTAEYRLAVAVLLMAAHDAAAVDARRRDSARSFLAGGPMLEFWCQLAGVNPFEVQRNAARYGCT